MFELCALFSSHIDFILIYYISMVLRICSVIDDEDLLKILELPILVVLDEAYIEFSGLESRMKWVKKHENLIVLRTFSKRAGIYIYIFNAFSLESIIWELACHPT